MNVQIEGREAYAYDVSVVIVSFNTRNVLRECLQTIYGQTGALRIQIIVVDNGSRDGSPEMLRSEFPDVVLMETGENVGFGRANNRGFEKAQGRYIVLLNSDAFLEPDALARSVAHMEAHPKAGLGGGRLIGRDGAWQPSARMFPTVFSDLLVLSGLASKFPQSRFFGRMDRTWANQMEAAEVDWVPGAYSIVRTEVLAKIGQFDPRFFLYYEEVDLCKRIQQAGYSIWYWPDVVVMHIGGESSRQVQTVELSQSGAQLTLWRMRSMLLYYRKHHGFAARLAMWMEGGWYSMRSVRRSFSKDPERRKTVATDRRLVSILRQAWRDTRGGRLSPAQPW